MPRLSVGKVVLPESYSGADGRGDLAGGEVGEGDTQLIAWLTGGREG